MRTEVTKPVAQNATGDAQQPATTSAGDKRGKQLAALRHLRIPKSVVLLTKAGKPNGTVSAAAMKAVLKCLDDHIDGKGYCWIKHETIAAETGYKLRTVKRACEALKRLGLITRKRKKTPYGITCNHYSIGWPRVEEFAVEPTERVLHLPLSDEDQSATVAPDQSAIRCPTKVPSGAPPKCHQVPDIETLQEPHNESLHEEGHRPPPPPPTEWGEVAEALKSLGVQYRKKAIRSAKDTGATPQDILQGIAYFREHHLRNGWGAAALQAWVTNWDPLTQPNEAWPAVSSAAAETSRRQESAELAPYVDRVKGMTADQIRQEVELVAAGGNEKIWDHWLPCSDLPGSRHSDVVVIACAKRLKHEHECYAASVEAQQREVAR